MKNLKVALVHDWMTGMRGGEKCLEVLCEIFPDAPIYTLLHNKGKMSATIESKKIYTSIINKLPFVKTRYRNYLPLFPKAIEQFNFKEYDLIISTSHCVAKSVITPNGSLHICYIHTPMRYIWDMFDVYFGKANFFVRLLMNFLRPHLQRWDVKTSSRADYFIANSKNIQSKVKKIYDRDSIVINPPVDVKKFNLSKNKTGKYFLIVSALVQYKKVDLAIECFNRNGLELLIVGTGPMENELKKIAKPNIKFLGWTSVDDLAKIYQNSIALIFPGEEDFGITPLEAMACGKPVIAYNRGGVTETVINNKTGIFFENQNPIELQKAIERLLKTKFNSKIIRFQALKFSRSIYKKKLILFIKSKIKTQKI